MHFFFSIWTFQIILVHILIFPICVSTSCSTEYFPGKGGELIYETDGDAGRLVEGCKFWILVSLRVFRLKRQQGCALRKISGSVLGPDYMVSFSPGWNFAPPTGLKYCCHSARVQNANFREKVYWSAKTQSMRMLAFLFRPGLKFCFDYMRLFQIFGPVWPGWKPKLKFVLFGKAVKIENCSACHDQSSWLCYTWNHVERPLNINARPIEQHFPFAFWL